MGSSDSQPDLPGTPTGDGDGSQALGELLPRVYEELRHLAAHYLQQERSGHTLQATALVHEAFLKLGGQREVQNIGRGRFLALAAQAMRRILVDHARTRGRSKRGGALHRTTVCDDNAATGRDEVDLLGLDDALSDLARLHARQARIVELRFFGGLTMAEVSEVLGVSLSTCEADWRMARAWLKRELNADTA